MRALTLDDVPALTRLFGQLEVVDRTGENYDESDLAEELSDPTVDLGRDTLAAVASDGTLVGWAGVRSASTVIDVDRVQLEGGVLPSRRGEGIGRELLDWAVRRGSDLHRERHPAVPAELAVWVPESVPSLEALVRAAGFRPTRWWYGMQRDLESLPPVPTVPAGLRLEPWTPARDDAVRRAHGEAFADHWGSVPPDAQRWAQWFTGSQGFRPSISRLVLDGDSVAAYLLSYFYEADAAATGVREAYIGQIGTLRPWRKRGLGTVLMAAALAAFRDEGYQRASLTVDTGNPTGALGLYERSGFAVDHKSVTWVRPVG